MADDVHKKIRELLEKEYAGYVLVTCKQPVPNGQMEVEMTYEGDPILAAYLLEGAQGYLDEGESYKLELFS
jgi:hypothetical protein